MVLGVFLGQKGTGGYSVEIAKIELSGAKLQVLYRQQRPPPGAIVSQVLTQPYHLVKLAASEAEAVFVEQGP